MAGQPSEVQKVTATGLGVTDLVLTPGSAVTAGNAMLVSVVCDGLVDFDVAGIIDSAGNDSFGVPLNNWVNLGEVDNGGVKISWWVCRGAVSVTSATVNFNGLTNAICTMIEWSGMNGVGSPILQTLGGNQNTVANQYLQQCAGIVPPNGATVLVGIFTNRNDTFAAPLAGGSLDSTNLSGATPNIAQLIVSQETPNTGTVEINNSTTSVLAKNFVNLLCIQAASATKLASQGNISACEMQCYFLILSGGLILNSQPGFADQPDASCAAEQFALGLKLAKINQNAAFGMVRAEFFNGIYQNGDTVPLPVSPVDGYVYQQSEVTYIWAVYSSCNPSTGWITGPNALWYCAWLVDQDTGLVTSEEWYRDDANSGVSNDGFLQVFTIAQRQRSSLICATPPNWTEMDKSLFTTDAPLSADTLVRLNNNAKFAAVGFEAIYLGEFYNGQQVTPPSSPIDGYQYSLNEVSFCHSWRWTTEQTQYTAPAWNTDWSFDGMYASIDSSGNISCKISWGGRGGDGCASDTGSGRIAVFALCNRAPYVSVPANSRVWDNCAMKNFPTFAYEYGTTLYVDLPAIATDTTGTYVTPRIPVVAGKTYVLRYRGGTIPTTSGQPAVDPRGQLGNTSGCPNGPARYVASGEYCFAGVGCFADDLGNIIGSVFMLGNSSQSLTVPSGATHIQLGVNSFGPDNTEPQLQYNGPGWMFGVEQVYYDEEATKFAEIADAVFYPGEDLPASTMLQLYRNIQEAAASPEVFGPTAYGPTDTVPAPTSPIDGYTYQRSELTYIWTWKQCNTNASFDTSNNNRIAEFTASIDQATGVVSTNFFRQPPGGPYDEQTNTDGVLDVWVIGFRTSQQVPIAAPTTDNPPSDATTTQTDGTGTVQVNGTTVTG